MMRAMLLGILIGILVHVVAALLLWAWSVWQARWYASRRWVYHDGDSTRVHDAWPEMMVTSAEVWPRPELHQGRPLHQELN